MSDLVKRLRHSANEVYGSHPCGLMSEAADRIAELEDELKKENQSALIKQLREIGDFAASHGWGRDTIYFRAADRIEELESKFTEAQSLLLQAHDQIFRLHENNDVAAQNLITKIRLWLSGAVTGGKKNEQ